MSRDQDPFDAKVLEILEEIYDAEERGESVDVETLCGGDARLASRVLEVLGRPKRVFGTTGRDGKKTTSSELQTTEIGTKLGRYRITCKIGRGAMGSVYEAIDDETGDVVAIKLIGLDGSDSVRVLRFEREAAIMRLLPHKNIVPVYAFERSKDQAWIAMKRLSGPSLDRLEKRPTVRDVARWGVAVARALDRAHDAGIVHRDIKPSNIILHDGEPMVADFGLARGFGDTTLTREGAAPGTLPYMPPEVLRGESGLDARTDIYALGATLYEAVAGHRAFFAPDDAVMIGLILLRDPPPLSMFPEDRDFETIILRAMSKEPHRRFPRASIFADDLERFLAGQPILSRRPGLIETAVRNIRRRPRTSALVAAAATVTLTATIWLTIEKTNQRNAVHELESQFDRSLDERRIDVARTLLSNLERMNGDGASSARASRRLAAVVAREDLLDQILDRWECQNPEILSAVIDRAASFGDVAGDESFDLAMAIAEIYRGRTDEAKRITTSAVARHGPSLAADAILAAVEHKLLDRKTPPKSADDLVLAACAQRLVADSEGLRGVLIADANRLYPGHYRAQFCSVILLLENDKYAAAESAVTTLERSDRFHAGRIRAKVAAALKTRSPDVARALDTIPVAQRSPMDHVLKAILARRADDVEAEARIIDNARNRWPNDFTILGYAVDLAIRSGNVKAARDVVDRMAATARSPRERRSADAMRMMSELLTVGGIEIVPMRLPPESMNEVAEILEEAEDRSKTSSDRYSRALFEWTGAWAARILGKIDLSRRLAWSAASHPSILQARIAFIKWTALDIPIAEDIQGTPPLQQDIPTQILRDARRSAQLLRELIDNENPPIVGLGKAQFDSIALAGAAVAQRAGDPDLARKCATSMLEFINATPERKSAFGGHTSFLRAVLEWSTND